MLSWENGKKKKIPIPNKKQKIISKIQKCVSYQESLSWIINISASFISSPRCSCTSFLCVCFLSCLVIGILLSIWKGFLRVERIWNSFLILGYFSRHGILQRIPQLPSEYNYNFAEGAAMKDWTGGDEVDDDDGEKIGLQVASDCEFSEVEERVLLMGKVCFVKHLENILFNFF